MSFSFQILKTGCLLVVTGGTIVASLVLGNKLSNTVKQRLHNQDNEDNQDNKNNQKQNNSKEIAYEYKYIEEYQERFDELNILDNENQDNPSNDSETQEKANNELSKKLNGKKIHEITPNGDVIMYYDVTLESFVYYCDDKNIPYKYLETVARKYSLDNNCLEVFVNMYDELKKGIQRQKEAKIKKCKEESMNLNDQDKQDNKNDVFVSFKQYNKTNPKEMLKQRKYITKENANRYSYRGNISTGRNLRIEDPKKKETISPMPVSPQIDETRPKQNDQTVEPSGTTDSINNDISDRKKMSFFEFKHMQLTSNENTLPVKTIEEWVESDNNTQDLNDDDSPTFSPIKKNNVTYQNDNEITMNEQELAELFDD